MTRARDLATAQHEAAHVVVGVALGLRLRVATLGRRVLPSPRLLVDGVTLFDGRRGQHEAWCLMLAAGVAWERAIGADWRARGDLACLRAWDVRGGGVDALARAAGALLRDLAPTHARVTRALLERDLDGADVAALARGERPAPDADGD